MPSRVKKDPGRFEIHTSVIEQAASGLVASLENYSKCAAVHGVARRAFYSPCKSNVVGPRSRIAREIRGMLRAASVAVHTRASHRPFFMFICSGKSGPDSRRERSNK